MEPLIRAAAGTDLEKEPSPSLFLSLTSHLCHVLFLPFPSFPPLTSLPSLPYTKNSIAMWLSSSDNTIFIKRNALVVGRRLWPPRSALSRGAFQLPPGRANGRPGRKLGGGAGSRNLLLLCVLSGFLWQRPLLPHDSSCCQIYPPLWSQRLPGILPLCFRPLAEDPIFQPLLTRPSR